MTLAPGAMVAPGAHSPQAIDRAEYGTDPESRGMPTSSPAGAPTVRRGTATPRVGPQQAPGDSRPSHKFPQFSGGFAIPVTTRPDRAVKATRRFVELSKNPHERYGKKIVDVELMGRLCYGSKTVNKLGVELVLIVVCRRGE